MVTWLLYNRSTFFRAFCYFNNVALAAKAMVSKSKRVMIVDWVRKFENT